MAGHRTQIAKEHDSDEIWIDYPNQYFNIPSPEGAVISLTESGATSKVCLLVENSKQNIHGAPPGVISAFYIETPFWPFFGLLCNVLPLNIYFDHKS